MAPERTKAADQALKPVDVAFPDAQMVDLCPLTNMAKILGCTNVRLSELTGAGHIPTVMVGGLRMYPVERVLRHVMSAHFKHPLAPLRIGLRRNTDYLDDTLWAWDALSAGPWNLKRAPTSRGWALYLEAKRHVASRMLLSRMHLLCAHREMVGGGRLRVNLGKPVADAEAAVLAEGSHETREDEPREPTPEPEPEPEPEPPPSIFGPIDLAKVANSPLVQPDPEPVSGETEY